MEIIESLSQQLIEWLKPYTLTRNDRLAILGKLMWDMMAELDAKDGAK